MMMPALGVRSPPETAERHWPPTTQMMTVKPVRVARLRTTGMETMYRLCACQFKTAHSSWERKKDPGNVPKAITGLNHLPHARLGTEGG